MCAIDHFFFFFFQTPASIYQRAPVLQIAPAVGSRAHMATALYRRFHRTADEVLPAPLWRNLLEEDGYVTPALRVTSLFYWAPTEL